MALSHSPSIVTSGLVLYLDAANRRSYPGSGTTWFDLSGQGNNGTLTNGPTFNSAHGGIFSFNGTSNYVSTNTSIDDTLGLGYTLSIWVYLNALNLPSGHGFINTYNGQGQADGFGLQTYSDNAISHLLTDSGGNNYIGQLSSFKMNNLTWYNISATWSGSFNSSSFIIYLNGIRLFSNNNQGGIVDSFDQSDLPVEIGRLRYGAGPTGYLNGLVSQVQIYNRPLSAIEIAQNFNATRGRFGI